MSGRYPGAQNLEEYWENLQSGKDCIGELPGERWPLDGFYQCRMPMKRWRSGKSYSKWGGFLSGFAEFDPLFFNISPREAANIDPQERLFIESCWQALEDGGYTREQLKVHHQGRVGVFAGITKTGFALVWSGAVAAGRAGSPAHLVRLGGQPGVVSSEPARAEHADRHDVLGVADGDP